MICALTREFSGHKDGCWDVTTSRIGLPIIGSASAGKSFSLQFAFMVKSIGILL